MEPRLAFDISRCVHALTDCPLAYNCLRSLAPGNGQHQSFSIFPQGDDCYAYLPWMNDTPPKETDSE